MLDRGAKRIVWAFLIGVIATEGCAIYASFGGRANLFQAMLHYAAAPAGTPAAWLCAALLAVLYVTYAAMRSAVIREHLLQPWRWRPFAAMCVVAVPMALVSGFFEEAFFRKFLMDWAAHHGQSAVVQIAASALAFGAAHAIWGIAGGHIRAAAGAMAATGALGAMLAVIYLIGGRSVAPCMAAHAAINLLIEPWLIMTAATNGWRRSASKAQAVF